MTDKNHTHITKEHMEILSSIRDMLYSILKQLYVAANGDTKLLDEIATMEKQGLFKNFHKFSILMLNILPIEQAITGLEFVQSVRDIQNNISEINAVSDQTNSEELTTTDIEILKEYINSKEQ